MKKILILVCLLILSGCASSPPTAEQLQSAEYGPYPSNWKEQVKERMKIILVDPDSVQYRFNYPEPKKAWHDILGDEGMFSTERIYGWRTCFQYNAKNSLGGYVGYKDVFVFFNNGQIALFNTKYGDVKCRGI